VLADHLGEEPPGEVIDRAAAAGAQSRYGGPDPQHHPAPVDGDDPVERQLHRGHVGVFGGHVSGQRDHPGVNRWPGQPGGVYVDRDHAKSPPPPDPSWPGAHVHDVVPRSVSGQLISSASRRPGIASIRSLT
jgi:hypothetical protein